LELLKNPDPTQWNQIVETLPGAHALQTWEWGQVKAKFGWEAHPLVWRGSNQDVQAAALVLQRWVSRGGFALQMSVMYCPRGPLLDWGNTALVNRVLDDLQRFARKQHAIFIKIDPYLPLGFGIPGEEGAQDHPTGKVIKDLLQERHWTFSDEQIQFRNTVVVDLTAEEDDLLMRMKSKTRYNIRLAERRGVSIRQGDVPDIDLLYQMYAHTAVRDDFLIRNQAYYQTVWQSFFESDLAKPLIAEVDGQPVGAVIVFKFGERAWYFYGMSLDEHREKMFNYRLQWEAMLYAKSAGCQEYDMWGAPDEFNEDDPMWGVYRFKDGFGGKVVRTIGAWDFPVRPIIYRLYNRILPKILGWMRNRGKSETQKRLNV
jgi:lipid II:glycine glycyltransferase (peptidoglycan interpeptide bridge formation enzyme)